MDYEKLSKEVSYALRHAPQEYGLELDNEGFASIEQLLKAVNDHGAYGRKVIQEDLEHIIETSKKKRHEISGDRIRALYGHSVLRRISKECAEPPSALYHGTTHEALPKIMEAGLLPMGRQYVHLSVDEETALKVGVRRDRNPVLLEVDAASASAGGIAFYVGNDKVWLSDAIPAYYLKILRGE